jgi:hypothetical protein
MYQFKIVNQIDGGYKFELGDIKMYVDDYIVINNQHLLSHPSKAIAYFNANDNIYGISNEVFNHKSAEDFFDAIVLQYKIINGAGPIAENSTVRYA